ncbi:MAG TPA: ANTAR domain-containing protein, partial [Arthrobacter sp.]
ALDVHAVNRAGDNLKEVLEGRTSIDVACGVIMAQNRCSYTEAFGKLASASRQRSVKVRSVAEGILKSVPTAALAAQLEPQAFA